MMIVVLLLSMLILASGYGAGRDGIDRTTVKNLNLRSIMGRWYEIARFDHSFERGMQGVMTNYTLQQDGTVRVENLGVKDGRVKVAVGRAKTTDEPGRLRVSFFWEFYSDYNILAIGDAQEWMVVGGRSPGYLWILSRTTTLEPQTLNHILKIVTDRGYDTEKLIFVKH